MRKRPTITIGRTAQIYVYKTAQSARIAGWLLALPLMVVMLIVTFRYFCDNDNVLDHPKKILGNYAVRYAVWFTSNVGVSLAAG